LQSSIVVVAAYTWYRYCFPNGGFRVERGKCVYVTVSHAPGSHPIITRPLPADPGSFSVVSPRQDATKIALEYAKDANTVFVGALTYPYVLRDCDPNTFSILSPDGKYACDCSHVYYCGIPLKAADPATFQILQPPYAKDSTHAFAGAAAIPVQDAASFEVVVPGDSGFPLFPFGGRLVEHDSLPLKTSIGGWARDKTAYYYADAIVAEADRESFEILNSLHAKDKNHVYYASERHVFIIPGADPSTFQVVGPSLIRGRDKNGEYLSGQAAK
jgi:hypothetical protein